MQIELTSKHKCVLFNKQEIKPLEGGGDTDNMFTDTGIIAHRTPQNEFMQTPSHQQMAPMTPGQASNVGTPFRDPVWLATTDLNLNPSVQSSPYRSSI